MPLKKSDIFLHREKIRQRNCSCRRYTNFSLAHFFIHFIFCGRRLQKIVVVICLSKICFSFACFKICFFNNLDWWSITKFSFILSHLVSVSASYFVIGFSLLFLLVLLHRKKSIHKKVWSIFFKEKGRLRGLNFCQRKVRII